jgi:fatty acid-binding protein DegV
MEDEIKPLERVRTSRRAMDRLVDFWHQLRDEGSDVFFIQHIQARDVAEELAERGRAIFGRDPEILSEIGPVIGAHVGPGLIGVSALPSAILGPV